jgi:hypothetical protein
MTQRDLPEPEILAIPPTTPVTRGWWEDPFETLQITQQRFHDGVAWTPYVVYLRGGLWSDIVEDPFFDDIPPV